MLRGAANVVIDDKGRWAMPKRYRTSLIVQCQGHFVCTIDHLFCCSLLYPIDGWERIEAKLVRLSNLHPAERLLQRLLLGHACECEMDA